MSNIKLYNSNDSLFTTEYNPKYVKMLLEYAYDNCEVDGFFGEHLILPETSEEWEQTHEDWRNALKMAQYKCVAGRNARLSFLLAASSGKQDDKKRWIEAPNIDTLTKLVLKMTDNSIRIEKDTGTLKRKGQEAAKKAKLTSNGEVNSELALKIANLMLNENENEE